MGSNSFLLSPILSDVSADLGTTPVVVARVISAFGAATALSSFLFGGMIDRFGERTVLVIGAIVITLALAGCAVSRSWQWLALCQTFIGLAVGVMLPSVYAAATKNAPKGGEAAVLGRVISGWGIALVAGVPFSALLSDLAGWRAPFAALSLFALVSGFGFSMLPKLRTKTHVEPPKSPASALRTPGVIPLLVACLAYMTAFYGIYAFLGDHLRSILGLSASKVGFVVLGYGAGFGLAGFADSTVDLLGPRRVLPTVLMLISGIYLALIPATQNYITSIGIAVVWGFINHIGVNIIILLLSRCDPAARGALMGLHTAVTYLSVFLGPLLLGMLYSIGFGAMALAAAGMLFAAALIAHGMIANDVENL